MTGCPTCLIEAQSQRLACISTQVSAIPELIEDRVTGLLAPPGDATTLARVMARLIRDPAERQRLGFAGEVRVRSLFAMDPGIAVLATRFGLVDLPVGGEEREVLVLAVPSAKVDKSGAIRSE